MTTAELAVHARTTPATVRYWRHKGTGPAALKVGRRVLYRVQDVEAWLDSLRAAEVTEAGGTPAA